MTSGTESRLRVWLEQISDEVMSAGYATAHIDSFDPRLKNKKHLWLIVSLSMIQELRKVLIKRKTQPAFTAALAIPVAEPPFKFKQFKDFEAGFDLEPPSLYVFSPEANFAELTEAKSFHVNFLGFVETFYAERNASAPDNLIRLVWVKAIDPSKYQP